MFRNFQEFEKFENEKSFPEIIFFVSLPSDSLQFQKQLMTNAPCFHQYIKRKNSNK